VLVERRSVPVPVPAGVVGGEPTMPAGERVSRWRVEGLFEARALPASGLAAIGLGASLSFRRKGGLILRVDVLADHAQKDVSLGSVAVDSLSTGPTLMLELHRGAFAVAGGAGVRIGVADLTGRPSDVLQARGASFVSVWGGPFVDAEVEVRVARGVAVVAGGELGDVPFPTRATVVAPGGGTVSIVGVWFGAYGGLALSF
jgi:hypothetical protein